MTGPERVPIVLESEAGTAHPYPVGHVVAGRVLEILGKRLERRLVLSELLEGLTRGGIGEELSEIEDSVVEFIGMLRRLGCPEIVVSRRVRIARRIVTRNRVRVPGFSIC
ncbi:MAG: hypothetical protein CL569_07975 [Alphaproteobacteria bacterium]|nr:hypothetical protein [Alphaproteobacteria bacterium]